MVWLWHYGRYGMKVTEDAAEWGQPWAALTTLTGRPAQTYRTIDTHTHRQTNRHAQTYRHKRRNKQTHIHTDKRTHIHGQTVIS